MGATEDRTTDTQDAILQELTPEEQKEVQGGYAIYIRPRGRVYGG